MHLYPRRWNVAAHVAEEFLSSSSSAFPAEELTNKNKESKALPTPVPLKNRFYFKFIDQNQIKKTYYKSLSYKPNYAFKKLKMTPALNKPHYC